MGFEGAVRQGTPHPCCACSHWLLLCLPSRGSASQAGTCDWLRHSRARAAHGVRTEDSDLWLHNGGWGPHRRRGFRTWPLSTLRHSETQAIPHCFEQGCPIELSVVTHMFRDLHWPFNTVTEPRVTSETEERGFSFYLNVSCHVTHGYWIGQHGSREYTFPF